MRSNPRSVERTIRVAATPARCFRALLDPAELKKWWGAREAVITPRKNGVWSLGWHAYGEENFYVTTAFIDKMTPNRELRLRDVLYFRPDLEPMGPMTLLFRLRSIGRDTEVTVRQANYGSGRGWDEYYRAVQDGWEKTLWNLKKYLERKGR
jgi:uncharacterized protein YndB with AHSA1/START domain